MKKYTVGQILYVVLKKEMRVYPMQVVEEINKKTLEGEETSYMVRGGSDPKAQLLLSEVDGEIFDSAEKAKVVLVDRATASITKLVDVAVQKSKEWYPSAFEVASTDDEPALSLLKKSPGAAVTKSKSSVVADLQEELLREAQQDSVPLADEFTLPDGTVAKVRSIKGLG